ncbi:hypothetical protein D0T84_05700 [Dysgonomonas sp. 521]|nr:hypothetical protein [Dysgonomonas sp. 521]
MMNLSSLHSAGKPMVGSANYCNDESFITSFSRQADGGSYGEAGRNAFLLTFGALAKSKVSNLRLRAE